MSAPVVDLWRADLDVEPGGPDLELLLSPDERDRAARARTATLRHRWMASRAALREVLAGYLGVAPAALAFETAARGKPSVVDHPDLRFNLAHAEGVALIGVSLDAEVGVDVEAVRPGLREEAIARRVLGLDAWTALATLEGAERTAAFFVRWARHEAAVKCAGNGLFDVPATSSSVTVVDVGAGEGFAAALAVAGASAPSVRERVWNPGGSGA